VPGIELRDSWHCGKTTDRNFDQRNLLTSLVLAEQHLVGTTQPTPMAEGRFLTTLLFGMDHEDTCLGHAVAIRFISSDLADAPSTNTIKSAGSR
jgi:hypothetical protein